MSTVPERLLTEATKLFASRGYEGASVRAICAAADTNLNAVSYHFGGKKGLYDAVLRGIGERRLASAHRILATPARNTEDLETRLLLWAEETLVAWLDDPGVLSIMLAELQQGFRNTSPEAMASLETQLRVLLAFLGAAREQGLLHDDVDVDVLAGGLIERLNTRVLYADAIAAQSGASIADPDHRRSWVQQVVRLTLYGATPR